MDNARFCRSCGTDLDLVSKALTGQLQVAPPDDDLYSKRGRRRKNRDEDKEPSVERAIQSLATGFGFILATLGVLFYFPGGVFWGYWLFIPAFTFLGKGVADYVRWKNTPLQNPQSVNQFNQPPVALPQNPVAAIPQRNTAEVYTPPSVTEQTTRHLDPAAQRLKDQS